MYELDRKKFGAFVSELRKEKGYTQKDLAQKLLISDKAISKWETGVSFPDTALLIPLAELFGVTVTELLMCERMEKEETMNGEQVENIAKTAIAYSEEKAARAYQTKNKWPIIYLCSLAVGIMGTLYSIVHEFHCETLITLLSSEQFSVDISASLRKQNCRRIMTRTNAVFIMMAFFE